MSSMVPPRFWEALPTVALMALICPAMERMMRLRESAVSLTESMMAYREEPAAARLLLALLMAASMVSRSGG